MLPEAADNPSTTLIESRSPGHLGNRRRDDDDDDDDEDDDDCWGHLPCPWLHKVYEYMDWVSIARGPLKVNQHWNKCFSQLPVLQQQNRIKTSPLLSLPRSAAVSLKTIRLFNVGFIIDLEPLRTCVALTDVLVQCWASHKPTSVPMNMQYYDLSSLSRCRRLKSLVLHGVPVVDVSPLTSCYNLGRIEFGRCVRLTSIDALVNEDLPLQHLTIMGSAVQSVCALGACLTLKTLYLERCNDLHSIDGLQNSISLTSVRIISENTLVFDWSPLGACTSLRSIHVSMPHNADESQIKRSIQAFAKLPQLCELRIRHSGARKLCVVPLSTSRSLRVLDLSHCKQLTGISSLAKCKTLQCLELRRSEVVDLRAMALSPSLQVLVLSSDIYGLCTRGLTDLQLAGIRVQHCSHADDGIHHWGTLFECECGS